MLLFMMLSSKGIAGVPRASLVVVAAVLPAFDLPEAGLLLIMGIDQFLDMGRTATNVIGNAHRHRGRRQVGRRAGAITAGECGAPEGGEGIGMTPRMSRRARAGGAHADRAGARRGRRSGARGCARLA